MSAFDLTNYTLTPYAVPPLVVGVLIASLGMVALIRERGTRVSALFSLLTTSTAVWLLTFTAIYSTPHQSLALWWTDIEHLGVVFIPSTAYLFTLVAVDRFREFRVFAWGGVALSGLFYLGILSTDWFVADMRRYPWGYYPQYGPLSIPFLVFFFGTTIVNLRLLWVESRRCASGMRKERLQGLLRAFCVGYAGSVDFLATYGIPLYPFGYLPILGFVVLVSREIWRYQLVDITPAFAAEQIIKTLPDALFVLDWNGRVRIVNQTACRLFGKSESELMGSPITTVSSALFKPDLIEALIQGDTPRSYEVTIQAPHDGVRALCVMASAMRDQDARPVAIVCIARDITERKQAEEALRQMEERLRQSQRMEAMGKLAGAVAHDFEKLLTVITRNSVLLLSGLDREHRLRGKFEDLKKAADQAATLTRHLLAFSSNQILQPKLLDLNNVVTNLHGTLHWLIGKDIELVTSLDPALGWLNADPLQIEQVIMNLAGNARDAMPQGGILTIKTTSVNLHAPFSHPHGIVPAGAYALLAVGDTGGGIDAETLGRLFEPYFTLKERSQGRGLGLATIYGIVKQSGGSITVASDPGRGTTFKVYLPLVERRSSH